MWFFQPKQKHNNVQEEISFELFPKNFNIIARSFLYAEDFFIKASLFPHNFDNRGCIFVTICSRTTSSSSPWGQRKEVIGLLITHSGFQKKIVTIYLSTFIYTTWRPIKSCLTYLGPAVISAPWFFPDISIIHSLQKKTDISFIVIFMNANSIIASWSMLLYCACHNLCESLVY